MRKTLIILVVLALVGIGVWAYFGGFERVTAARITWLSGISEDSSSY